MVEFQVAEWLFVAENESDDRNFAEGAITWPEMAQRHHRDRLNRGFVLFSKLSLAPDAVSGFDW